MQLDDNFTLNHPARDYVDNFFIVLFADGDALFEINAGLYCLFRGCLPFSIFTSDFKTHCGKFETPPENFEHDEQHAVDNLYKTSGTNPKKKEEMYEKYKIICHLSYSIIDKDFISPEKDVAFFLLFFLLREACNSCSILYDKRHVTNEKLYGLTWVIEEVNGVF